MATKVVLAVLFTLLTNSSCTGGWSVAGWEITPSDSTHTLQQILDQDSTIHIYEHPFLVGEDNWCFKHDLWEQVERKLSE